jgi:hypothetical protein
MKVYCNVKQATPIEDEVVEKWVEVQDEIVDDIVDKIFGAKSTLQMDEFISIVEKDVSYLLSSSEVRQMIIKRTAQ